MQDEVILEMRADLTQLRTAAKNAADVEVFRLDLLERNILQSSRNFTQSSIFFGLAMRVSEYL